MSDNLAPRCPRSMREAFGPYTDHRLQPLRQSDKLQLMPVIAGIGMVAAAFIGLLIVATR